MSSDWREEAGCGFVVWLMLSAVAFSVGLVVGIGRGQDEERRSAVEAGAGFYAVDTDGHWCFKYRNGEFWYGEWEKLSYEARSCQSRTSRQRRD